MSFIEFFQNFNIKFFIKQIITTTFNKISNILYKNNLLVLNKVYSPFSLITWLRIKTKGKLVYYNYDFKKKGMELGEINHDIRDKIYLTFEASSDFEKLLLSFFCKACVHILDN